MKRTIFLACALLMLMSSCIGVSPVSEAGKLSVEQRSIDGISSEGGSAQGIFINETLIALTIDVYGEMGKVQYSFSFSEGVIFLSVVTISYVEPFYVNPGEVGIDEIHHERFIIANDDLYKLSLFDEQMESCSDEQRSDILKLLADANEAFAKS